MDGFTTSEFDPAALLTSALIEPARKHRKRSPKETARIQTERTGIGVRR